MKKIIEVRGLSKEFKTYEKKEGMRGSLKNVFARKTKIKRAVDDISFDIAEGEFVGFVGPNGAGKTTAIKMLSGILVPTSGTIEILGYEPKDRNTEYQRQFGIVLGQKNQINLDLPPVETFLLMKEVYGVSDEDYKEKLDELVRVLDVGDVLNVQARRLSLGQRMKCELILALLHSPRVLFLDEPTIGLDVTSQRNIREFLSLYNKKNKTTIILTSHYMQDIERLCDRIIIIDLGKIIFDGSLEEMSEKYVKNKKIEITMANDSCVERKIAEKFGHVVSFEDGKIVYEVPREEVTTLTTELINKLPVADLTISEVDIEEIITDIFKENQKKGARK